MGHCICVDVCVRVVWLYRLLSCLALHCGESSAVDVGCQLLQSINDVTRVSSCGSFAPIAYTHTYTILTAIFLVSHAPCGSRGCN